MRHKIALLLMGILSITMLLGCNQTENKEAKVSEEKLKQELTIVMSGPKAPPTIPLLRMIDTNALGENVKIDLKIWNSVEEALAIANGSEPGFLAVPVNTAAKLYNKGIDIKLTNVNTWGVMYLSTTDPNCNKWEDLKGKKLYIPFKSTPPDIVTQYFLNEHGLEAGKDVEIVYSTPPEISQMIQAGEIQYAMNIEPYITASQMKNDNVRVILNYMDEWKKIIGNEYDIPNAGIIVNNKFLKDNKELGKLFEQEYEKALKWTLENPKESGELAEKYLRLNKDLIEKAMPNFGLNYKQSNEAKKELEKYYETFLNFKPDSIGGRAPDENFYYKEK